ncbi:MAG TPA: VWA domain-containing protein [Candidatus Acidoferrum sp.]
MRIADIHRRVIVGGAVHNPTGEVDSKMGSRSQLAVLLALSFLLIVASPLSSSPPRRQTEAAQPRKEPSVPTVPARPAKPLYAGQQGAQPSEITFVPLTRTVTAKFHVEDPNGYFLPNLRRENFAVYEDGARQRNVTVEVEHAAVSVALLLEFGGRYHELNKRLALEVRDIGRQLLETIGREDKIAIFKYGSKLETLADFNSGHETLDNVFESLNTPGFSEVNFYDSLHEVLGRMRDVAERKAIIVVSSGVDTFSKTTFEQLLGEARTSAVPIYAIGLGHLMELEAMTYGSKAPFARINWQNAQNQLEDLARASGGRAYLLESDVEIPGIYDDIMENLRLRYVVTYVSANPASSGPPRSVRVDLIDPKTGGPLKIHDATGRLIPAKVFLQETYSPVAAESKASMLSRITHGTHDTFLVFVPETDNPDHLPRPENYNQHSE